VGHVARTDQVRFVNDTATHDLQYVFGGELRKPDTVSGLAGSGLGQATHLGFR
jgi:hypothetical protein